MSIRRASKSSISTTSRGKGSNLIAGYSPAVDEMDLIQRVTVGAGGAANIEFTAIPGSYQHLQIRCVVRSARVDLNMNTAFRVNGDSGNNYATHRIWENGSGGIQAASNTSLNYWYPQYFPGASTTANVFGAGIIDIIDYSNTTKNKVFRSFFGFDSNGGGTPALNSGLWMNTSAITSITLFDTTGANIVQHSIASLYGVIG